MLCDHERVLYAEHLDGDLRVTEAAPGALAHTNHYLHPDFAPADELNVFARNSSRRRLDAAREGIAALPADANPEDHFALLARPPYASPTGATSAPNARSPRPCCSPRPGGST